MKAWASSAEARSVTPFMARKVYVAAKASRKPGEPP